MFWWTVRRSDEKRLRLEGMYFMSRTVESILFDCISREEIT